MLIFLATLLATASSIVRSRAALELENLALRHQIGVLQRSARLRLRRAGQLLTMLPLVILPSALENGVGALIASFRSSIPCPPIPLFYASLAARDNNNAKLGAERLVTPFS